MQVEYIYVVERAGKKLLVQFCVPGDVILHVIVICRIGDKITFTNDCGPTIRSPKMITWANQYMLKQDIAFLDMESKNRPWEHPFHGNIEEGSADKYRNVSCINNTATVKDFNDAVIDTFSYKFERASYWDCE